MAPIRTAGTSSRATNSQLKNVIGGGFGAYYDQAEDGSFVFDPQFVLVDGWGIRRAAYRTANPDPALIERDLRPDCVGI